MTLADRIVVMNLGEIVQMGTPLEIYADPVSYFVADFFGNPAMNLVPGEFVERDGALHFASPQFDIPMPARYRGKVSGSGTLGIRPENVRIGTNGRGGGASITSKVNLVEPLGKDTLLYFETDADRPFVAVVEGTRDFERHQPVTLVFPDDNLYLFDSNGGRVR